jgi:negative regulator of sigma E activity
MNDALKMQISAFVDGELPENEAELLMRRLNQDVAMRQQVAQYLAIGRCVRRDVDLPGMNALRGRIAGAMGEEAFPAQQTQSVEGPRFLKPAIGFAVAASVAILAVVGLRQSITPEADGVAPSVAIAESVQAPAITQAPASSVDAEVVSGELREMYRRHSASSADFGASGMITRLVTLELQGGELVEIDPDSRIVSPTLPDDADAPGETPDGTSIDEESQSN